LRDHFRQALLDRDRRVANIVVDLLAERPSLQRVVDIRELEPILISIELLLEAGDFDHANELYRDRLENGGVFRWLPAFSEGMYCALSFVASEKHRKCCTERLGLPRLGYFLNETALFAMEAGELSFAVPFYEDNLALKRRSDDKINLSVNLQNYADLLVHFGQLDEAASCINEALMLADQEENDRRIVSNRLAYLGMIHTYRGHITEAIQAFENANGTKKYNTEVLRLYSLPAIHWAELMLRLGQTSRARTLTEANLEICKRNQWQHDVARCHYILGRTAIAEGRFAEATEYITTAEDTMRRGHQLLDLPNLLLARATLEYYRKLWDEALRFVNETLLLAMPRRMRLAHADALVLRGRILLERGISHSVAQTNVPQLSIERAYDDADAALTLARQSGYLWAERDALVLLTDACQTLGNVSLALSYRRDAEVLIRRLSLD
jgi:tetratricopeptide (TPR) repeat protein